MFIELKHKSLDVYQVVKALIKEVYAVSLRLPNEEKFNIIPQMRRASLSAKLNLTEGATRKSMIERKHFFEVARGSVVEIDAILETAVDLQYLSTDELKDVGVLLKRSFAMLSRMIDL